MKHLKRLVQFDCRKIYHTLTVIALCLAGQKISASWTYQCRNLVSSAPYLGIPVRTNSSNSGHNKTTMTEAEKILLRIKVTKFFSDFPTTIWSDEVKALYAEAAFLSGTPNRAVIDSMNSFRQTGWTKFIDMIHAQTEVLSGRPAEEFVEFMKTVPLNGRLKVIDLIYGQTAFIAGRPVQEFINFMKTFPRTDKSEFIHLIYGQTAFLTGRPAHEVIDFMKTLPRIGWLHTANMTGKSAQEINDLTKYSPNIGWSDEVVAILMKAALLRFYGLNISE